jgi:hypothetical protein
VIMQARFNASEYFVDRHLQEGRGERVAIECGDERVTYAQLSERVNRFGAGLRDALAVRMEERVLPLRRTFRNLHTAFGRSRSARFLFPSTRCCGPVTMSIFSGYPGSRRCRQESLAHLILQIPGNGWNFCRR